MRSTGQNLAHHCTCRVDRQPNVATRARAWTLQSRVHFNQRTFNLSAGMSSLRCLLGMCLSLSLAAFAAAQSVCLPAPRLLHVFPMGAQIGTTVEVTVSGENLDELAGLTFSDPRVTATPVQDEQQRPIAGRYRVTVPDKMQPGLVEAYAIARLGVSTGRIFSVGTLTEVAYSSASANAEEAQPIQFDSTVNAATVARSINHYQFSASAGQLCRIDCTCRGIDSKLDPVVTLTDSSGRILATDRQAAGIEFLAERDDRYVIKVHDLTYQGGPEYFYRLSLQLVDGEKQLAQFASTQQVAQYSWPPYGYAPEKSVLEAEVNDAAQPQSIELPCQIRGSFFPAADVDCFEFTAIKGQQWWIEVASHRLGAATGPAGIVQRAVTNDGSTHWQDILELKDIASPMKVSSNNYAYDGPPYNGGSTDLIGMLDVPEDGLYRLQLNDLFGGTRDDPASVYELVIREAEPDFALTGWVKHLELRNGDRNALSKPLALRSGATLALEIGAFRRDGFAGPIRLETHGLPAGVYASAIDIPAGQTTGHLLLTAQADAPKSLGHLRIVGHGEVAGQALERNCQLATMAWPIRDHWQEFPKPRLTLMMPVSVTDAESSTITIQSAVDSSGRCHIQAVAGSSIAIPLSIHRSCEFSGSVLNLTTIGNGFQSNSRFEIALQESSAEVKLDLAALKTEPGIYTLAFLGPAVAKYRDYPQAVDKATAAKQVAAQRVEELTRQREQLAAANAPKSAEQSESSAKKSPGSGQEFDEQQLKDAEAALMAADEGLKAATRRSQPQDIVDIIVTRPVTLEVLPKEESR
ncbi:MAG: serine protease [Pirellulaceae bacterium]|nr:serine protease [Pirellulaceae bacterium]